MQYNFCRPLLERAKKYKKDIATDIHVISDIKDEYNKDFMQAANILFMSDEGYLVLQRNGQRR
jgi:ribokinase